MQSEEKRLPITPIFARVLLKRPIEEKTTGGILLTNARAHAQAKGIVVAVGETCAETVKNLMGKTVYFGKFAGDWLTHKNEEYYICLDEDILAGVNDD